MRTTRKVLLSTFTSLCFLTLLARSQDAPSLGDVARQARLQKQQKEAQAKDSAPSDASEKASEKGKDAADAGAANAQGTDAQTKDAPMKDASTGKAKDTDAKAAQPAKTPHLVTNEDLPEHVGPTRVASHGLKTPDAPEAEAEKNDGPKAPAEYWRQQIQAQKNSIISLESQMNLLNDSVQYAGGNCVSNCVQWNERQKQKRDQVETMKAQLEEQQKHLEDLQDQARKQGYGSSVYDP